MWKLQTNYTDKSEWCWVKLRRLMTTVQTKDHTHFKKIERI